MNDQLVILTGHAGGIGSSIATKLADAGYNVIGIDHSEPVNFSGETLTFDLTSLTVESSQRHFSQLLASTIRGRSVAALINNAAIQHVTPLRDAKPTELLAAISVNAIAPLVLFQALRTDLIQSNGTVVNISSVHTRLTKPDFGIYAMSKSALSSLTRTLSIEEGNRIRIIEVSPGAVSTPMLEQGFSERPEQRRQLDAYQPLGRIATATEVAEVCVELLRMNSQALNGTVVNLDGGISCLLHDPV